jgi:hypothetical protein
MATPQEIAALRAMINQPDNVEPWTDQALSDRIDAFDGTTLQQLAGQVWAEKAASYSVLVDMQEGSSKRNLSQLQGAALKMAAHYSGETATGGAPTMRPARTRPIERL